MLLFDSGATALSEELALDGTMTLTAGFDSQIAVLAAKSAVHLNVHNIEIAESPQSDVDGWAEARREWLTPVMTSHWFVRPPWISPTTRTDLIDMVIDPGVAFGDAGHQTTRLMLDAVSNSVYPGARVLDIGAGTGILAIAAAHLGADVTAIEIDEHAAGVAQANVERNGVDQFVRVVHTDATEEPFQQADCALINVTIDVHRALAGRIAQVPLVIVSGVLSHQVEEAIELYWPRRLENISEADGWAALLLRVAETT